MIAVREVTLSLKCDCHGNQTMMRLVDGVLVVMLKTHGENHVLRIPLDKLVTLSLGLQPKL